ncbi:MAG: hypothetical protein JXP34_21610 [Planctomycetes bacterium]|nr:hypothetical protein [Planctomycetota bacterium]
MKRSVSKHAIVVYAVALLFAVLAVDRVAGLVLGRPAEPRRLDLLKEIRTVTESGARESTIEDYETVRADRFLRPVPPPPPSSSFSSSPSAPSPTSSGEAPRPIYILRGTLIHSNPALSWAFIEIPGVREQQGYRLGDTIDNAQIVSIEDEEIRLRRGDEEITVTVSFTEDGRSEQRVEAARTEERRPEPRPEPSTSSPPPQVSSQESPRAGGPRSSQGFQRFLDRLSPEDRETFLSLPQDQRMEFIRSRRPRDGSGRRGGGQ